MSDQYIKQWQQAIGVKVDGDFGPTTLRVSLEKIGAVPHDDPPATVPTVRQLAEAIVDREGGFVNDPSDPGGATNFGVTIFTMRALGLDLDHDGDVDITDVHLMTRDRAVDIFIKNYFEKPGIAKLPPSLQPEVFDMYVNSGNNAIKILQRMANVTADGVIGPNTITAVGLLDVKGGISVADQYAIARREWYYSVADARPASRKYCRTTSGGKGGWIIRAEEFMTPSLRYTDAQHRARCSRWA